MKRFNLLLVVVAVIAAAALFYSATRTPAAGPRPGGDAPVPMTAADSAFKGYALGSDSAPVKIVEYVDFECPICAEFGSLQFPYIRDQLIKTGKVQWRIRDYPLPPNVHPYSRLAALATQCAGEQGKYFEMIDQLFNHHQWAQTGKDPTALFHDLAVATGIDGAAYDACVSSNRYAGRVEAGRIEGEARGVNGTPTIYINGKEYTGQNRSSDAFQAIVDSLTRPAKRK